MTAADIVALLEERLGAKIASKSLDAIDPFVVVGAGDLPEVMGFLRDDERLRFDMLHNSSGVASLEPDPKKVAKAGYEPHLEVVYHLQSFAHTHRFTVKVMLPRWKADRAGDLPEVPSVADVWRVANWHEREVYDLCGVMFTSHPD